MSTATPMPRSVSMPRLPSMSEIEKSLREKLPGLRVYNPSREWVPLTVFGLTFFATPDLEGAVEPHPVTGASTPCDGVTVIRGRFIDQKDSSGKKIEGQDAPAMVKFLVSPENYGQMGLVWLPGSSIAEDENLKKASQSVFLSYQSQHDEMIVAKRVEFKSNWTKSGLHKGEPCPPPTAAESSAMDRLQERKRATIWKYECDAADCPGYAVNEWERFAAHMKSAHKLTVSRDRYEQQIGGLAGVVAEKSEPEPDPVTGIAAAARMLVESAPDIGMEEDQVETESAKDKPAARRRK